MMDDSVSPNLESQLKPTQTHESKKRKLVEKIVVSVKVGENGVKLKNEGAPSDLWSWRKYGQKPIKGSPYPRGYYRCSTSKGCSAKKQVERSKTDASMLIITYTSTYNHPGPDLVSTQANHADDKIYVPEVSQPSSDEEGHFHYLQSPLRFPQSVVTDQEEAHDTLVFVLDEEPLSCTRTTISSSGTKSDENDFFDELEELPICSAFTSFMRSNKFLDEGIHVFPS